MIDFFLMRRGDLSTLVDGTRDAAYVVDSDGTIVAWNDGAAKLFGISAVEAVGRACYSIIQGVDESGRVCSPNCIIRQAIQQGKKLSSFDMQVKTSEGLKWCSATVFVAETVNCSGRCAVHILRMTDTTKRLELAVRNYLLAHTRSSAEEGTELLTSTTASHHANLSVREIDVLRMLASGGSTRSIAAELHISVTTVSNHIQHILHKLDSHSRLEVIRRAERSGLI